MQKHNVDSAKHDASVLIGVSGSIAAYKVADIVSALKKTVLERVADDVQSRSGIDVSVVMTSASTAFITPLTLQVLSQNSVYIDVLDEPEAAHIAHINLPQSVDVFCLAPASANVIAKIAHGIADDQLTSMVLALPPGTPRLLAPAMNTIMYQNVATQDNLVILKRRGWQIIDPVVKRLACGDEGVGALAPVQTIVDAVVGALLDVC
jgi:phosphopantothenoylcysteine decarboxylase